MRKGKFNLSNRFLRRLFMSVFVILLIQEYTLSQNFVVSFPIGSTVYQDSELPLTVAISGVQCGNTVIKSHRGLVSVVGDCLYIYRCKIVGIDTVEVFVRRGGKLHRIGQQAFEVKKRPLPKATVAGLSGGSIRKGVFIAQSGVGGSWYIGGSNHWERCAIESYSVIIIRDGAFLNGIRNNGNFFSDETREILKQLQSGDRVLVTDIKGCLQQGVEIWRL